MPSFVVVLVHVIGVVEARDERSNARGERSIGVATETTVENLCCATVCLS
jgi:hypothetical protein